MNNKDTTEQTKKIFAEIIERNTSLIENNISPDKIAVTTFIEDQYDIFIFITCLMIYNIFKQPGNYMNLSSNINVSRRCHFFSDLFFNIILSIIYIIYSVFLSIAIGLLVWSDSFSASITAFNYLHNSSFITRTICIYLLKTFELFCTVIIFTCFRKLPVGKFLQYLMGGLFVFGGVFLSTLKNMAYINFFFLLILI